MLRGSASPHFLARRLQEVCGSESDTWKLFTSTATSPEQQRRGRAGHATEEAPAATPHPLGSCEWPPLNVYRMASLLTCCPLYSRTNNRKPVRQPTWGRREATTRVLTGPGRSPAYGR
ncbi:hypothetical protein NDU88_001109 [Pleurodeles waltl]|uniref:Uncharacterized protein n=1 Tax=Pleurodeles waltl TaxID=8319 RepID=A0AAV7P4F3_PLEWA|nr:hypothetical protein NDU88_001109 [Pleurodeles waltl]